MTNDTDGILIRRAHAGDDAGARAVHRAAFGPLRPIYRATGEAAARQEQRFQEGQRIVAEAHGEIVGTLQVVSRETDIHLMGLAVDPGYRGRGVASKLVQWAIAHARERGYPLVTLVAVREAGTVPFFQRLGFTIAEESVADWATSDIHDTVHNVAMEFRV